MKYTALVPVKSLKEAKSRLAEHLTGEQRARLMLQMLHHVITVLQDSQIFDHISVVSPDPIVLAQVDNWGARALLEEDAGHNPALTAAARREMANGTTALLTISADLPLLQAANIIALIEQLQWHDVVLATSQDGTGTNALLTRPPLVVPYVFGLNSLSKYRREAEQRQLSAKVYKTLGLALDVDTIEDLELLQDVEVRQHYTKVNTDAVLIPCR